MKEPQDRVSGNAPKTWSNPRIPVIKDAYGLITCSCGWFKVHDRQKVREERAQAHLDKRHEGTGAWM